MVNEGYTHAPQTPIVHTLHRGMHEVERIVWLGAVGTLSFPALHWCTQQDITVLLLTRDGALLNTLTPGRRPMCGYGGRSIWRKRTGRMW